MSNKKDECTISPEEINKRRKGLDLIEEWMLKLTKANEKNSKNE